MKKTLKIEGMHCKSCEMLITDSLENLNVKSKVDSKKGTAEIEFDENSVTFNDVKKAIEGEGFKVK